MGRTGGIVMSVAIQPFEYGDLSSGICVESYAGFHPRMSDYHMHEHYEISLILSGNVHVLLSGLAEFSSQAKLVLTRPYTPHYIYCEPDMLYNRINISFTPDFIADTGTQWQKLLAVFGKNGSVRTLPAEQCAVYQELFQKIQQDCNLFRKRLLLLYFLSLVSDDLQSAGAYSEIPPYVTEALAFISTRCSEHIICAELASQLNVCRTTLMTAFKKYTGMTVNEYLTRCRLKNAASLLQSGTTEQETAEKCGLTDACNLIRSFKRIYGMTPKQYLASVNPPTK